MEISLKEENNQTFSFKKKKKRVSALKIEILNFPLSFQLIGSIVHHPSGPKQQSFLLQDNIQRPSFLLETQGRETPFPALLLPEVGGGGVPGRRTDVFHSLSLQREVVPQLIQSMAHRGPLY